MTPGSGASKYSADNTTKHCTESDESDWS